MLLRRLGGSVALLVLLTQSASCSRRDASSPQVAADVLARDRSMSEAAHGRARDRFLSHLTDGAIFLGGGGPIEPGRDAVARAWAAFFEPAGPRISWQPSEAVVSESGGVAYSTGSYVLEPHDPGAEPRTGRYVTVWRHDEGAGWRVVFDASLTPVPEGVPLERTPLRRLEADDLRAVLGRYRTASEPRTEGGYLSVQRRTAGTWHTVVDVANPLPSR